MQEAFGGRNLYFARELGGDDGNGGHIQRNDKVYNSENEKIIA